MKRVVFIALIFLVLGCGEDYKTKFQSPEEFHTYLNDPNHGFIQSETSEAFSYEAKLVPPVTDDPKSHFTIQLRIKRLDGGSVLDFGEVDEQIRMEREGYLSFELLEDVYIKSGSTTLSPVFHHYERNYGLKPSVDVLFEFPMSKIQDNATFCLRDEVFGQGLIELEFDKEQFNKCYVSKK